MTRRTFPSRRALWLGALALLLGSGCAGSYDVWGFVVDDRGEPLPGALLYVEAYTHGAGAYDFVWGEADSAGRVTGDDGHPLRLAWRSGAKLAVAVLAPGKAPLVIYDELGRIEVQGTQFALHDSASAEMYWEPRLAKLGFPFQEKSSLNSRLAQPANRALLAAFHAAYESIRAGEVSALPAEWEKSEAIERLLTKR